MTHRACIAITVLLLAACTAKPREVEYVAHQNEDGTPASPLSAARTVYARFKADTAKRTVTFRFRLFLRDSLVGSLVDTLGEGKDSRCTMFSASSWTCTDTIGMWTLDNNVLSFVVARGKSVTTYHPQPVTTP